MKKIIPIIVSILLILGLLGSGITLSSISASEDLASISSVVSSSFIESNPSPKVGYEIATPIIPSKIPAFSGNAYVTINNNIPSFSANELTTIGYEKYSPLDSLGRTQMAIASVGKDTMPDADEERGDISSIKPSGWVQAKYDVVSGGWLYNRCHLIGWQLSAENANKNNLITGTKYLNVSGMLPFENMVADYIKETGNHVAYRITPIYESNNLLASGIQMEAYSVEDNGEGICFNVYCYNIQPKITIDYATGASQLDNSSSNDSTNSSGSSDTSSITSNSSSSLTVWIPQSGKKYHSKSTCSNMKNPRQVSKSEAESMGYTPCSKCCEYEQPTYTIGDCNNDGSIDTTDLASLKLFLAAINDLSDVGKLGADLNEDGNVDTTDLAILKLKLAGIE
ncbi:MAG: hypothetical protein E7565_00845 [Ruminococcaceae bacterium]|nr:hypothetical protein [Oscillospiraceae bacterium]